MIVERYAEELQSARLQHTTVSTVSGRWPGMTVDDAYRIQAAGIGARVRAGETVIGGKLGFTSAAMRRAMGVASPNYGWLTDSMLLAGPDGTFEGDVAAHHLVHPKVEPEIAFRLSTDLVGPVTPADVLAGTESVMACLEIVDSRFVGFRFGPMDNIADNSSSGKLVLGSPVPLGDIDLRLVGVVVEVDGVVHGTAAGAAAHGDPAAAVAWMANHCDQPLLAGSIVISGGLTSPVTLLEPADREDAQHRAKPTPTVIAHFDRLGSVSLRFD